MRWKMCAWPRHSCFHIGFRGLSDEDVQGHADPVVRTGSRVKYRTGARLTCLESFHVERLRSSVGGPQLERPQIVQVPVAVEATEDVDGEPAGTQAKARPR